MTVHGLILFLAPVGALLIGAGAYYNATRLSRRPGPAE